MGGQGHFVFGGPDFHVACSDLPLVLCVWLVLLIRTQLASDKGEQRKVAGHLGIPANQSHYRPVWPSDP